ncbi:uncharacterized protein A4U43_C03F10280 [Asparagus officinalis]|uniref:Uncharacterized protein n=1 Tax=Asparagus officinalis TaxID=4686 RepID=A0A5P1FDX1_ASPOF|nr:uncharacterized protein A4U43_C03F10280 [Asparagus officinalis]
MMMMEGLKNKKKEESFHVIHKVPAGDSPYVRAKHLQSRQCPQAIKSFRHLCSKQAQDSLDNLLIDLYKKCGQIDQQIQLLKQKLRAIYLGEAFNGKTTKTARSHGKKFQVSIQQETARILGNLGWAYMQQNNYDAAEVVYRKAQLVEPDANKACNLGLCLMKMGRFDDARCVLGDVVNRRYSDLSLDESNKTVARAEEMMKEIEELRMKDEVSSVEEIMERLDVMNEWTPFRSRRLPIFEEITPFRDQMAC